MPRADLRRPTQLRNLAVGRRLPLALVSAAREAVGAQADLLANASSLLGTTFVTSVLGVGYWWVAARLLSPTSVGYGSGALSAMTLLGTLGMMGFGTLLMGRLAEGGESARGLVGLGLATASVSSAVLGAAFGMVAMLVSPGFAPYVSTVPGVLLFAAGAALTSASLVLDNALIGMSLGAFQLWRNTAFGVIKLVALAAIASLVPEGNGVGIILAWTVGLVASFVVVLRLLHRSGRSAARTLRVSGLRRLAGPALLHHWLNLATYAPRLIVPLVVTGVLSAELNGAFYPAWIVATMVYIAPSHLATSLFAVGSANRTMLTTKTRFALKAACTVGVPLSLLLLVAANPLLRAFGGPYAEHATTALQLLMLGYLPNVVRFHYVALRRVQNRLCAAATTMTALGALEVAAAAAGAHWAGLTGLGAALTAAMWIEVAATLGPVVKAMELRAEWRGA